MRRLTEIYYWHQFRLSSPMATTIHQIIVNVFLVSSFK